MNGTNIAVYVDFENVALGAKEAGFANIQMDLVLARMLEKGSVILKKAYCDWARYSKDRPALHTAGFELVEVPHVRYSGKNSADIRMAVDAIDVAHTKPHIDMFTVVSGDSDFSPLVSKLRENGKSVVGVGVKPSTSQLLVEACDEFVYYEDLVQDEVGGDLGQDGKDALKLVTKTAEALLRDRGEPVWGSHVKQVLKRKRPNWRESHFGYRSFSDVLRAAREKEMMKLRKDETSGGFIVLAAGSTRA